MLPIDSLRDHRNVGLVLVNVLKKWAYGLAVLGRIYFSVTLFL